MSSTRPLRPSTRNILRVFHATTVDDRAAGNVWYFQAHDIAAELAATHHVTIERAAAVLAVLSPMTSWPLNVRRAREAFADPHGISFLNAGKARRLIVDNENPSDVVGGPKVTAFWHSICDPESQPVTVDRHAIDIACGRVLTNDERSRLVSRKGAYDNLAQLYSRAAAIISRDLPDFAVTAVQVQATTWTYWRRERAAANHG